MLKYYDKTISELVSLPIDELADFFNTIKLDKYEQKLENDY